MMMKFWNAAIWSNFSAHRPAISPSEPIRPRPARANTTIHHGSATRGGANQTVTSEHAQRPPPGRARTEAPT